MVNIVSNISQLVYRVLHKFSVQAAVLQYQSPHTLSQLDQTCRSASIGAAPRQVSAASLTVVPSAAPNMLTPTSAHCPLLTAPAVKACTLHMRLLPLVGTAWLSRSKCWTLPCPSCWTASTWKVAQRQRDTAANISAGRQHSHPANNAIGHNVKDKHTV
jgi:hypothetical protein